MFSIGLVLNVDYLQACFSLWAFDCVTQFQQRFLWASVFLIQRIT